MTTLRGAMNLAQWIMDRKDERSSTVQWIRDELNERGGGGLSASLFFNNYVGPLEISTIRAIRDRVSCGDPISIMTINSMVNFMGEQNKEATEIAIRCAPLTNNGLRADEELRNVAMGLEMYPNLFDELTGENWLENSKLLTEAALHIWDNFGIEGLIKLQRDENEIWRGFCIDSEETAALILEQRDRYDEIMDIIGSRNTVDAGIIKSILESDAKALSSGSL